VASCSILGSTILRLGGSRLETCDRTPDRRDVRRRGPTTRSNNHRPRLDHFPGTACYVLRSRRIQVSALRWVGQPSVRLSGERLVRDPHMVGGGRFSCNVAERSHRTKCDKMLVNVDVSHLLRSI
jgi:hypothetical protein